MKKQIVFLTILCVTALLAGNNKVYAQSGNTKSNGTLQIIKVCTPDSVIFTVATGKEIEGVSVSLVGKGQEINGETRMSGAMSLKTINGKMVFFYNDGSRFISSNFKIPAGFKPEQIKFTADGKVMYYNIALSKWEKR